ncbi:MAG: DUF6655 family protein [Planctomycetia bacterium]|nr:DUF6655 family protein [Planctomycetia bacterium]
MPRLTPAKHELQSGDIARHAPFAGAWAMLAIAVLMSGCGVTRRSDTTRTASEQLLISNAVDQAVAQLDFGPIAGKNIYFDPQYLAGAVDEKYLISTLRQHLLHHGCVLQTDRMKAEYIVEARAGAIGTDRHDITVGVPAVNLPVAVAATGVPPVIPEIPFAKSTDQKGVAKIAVFAYEQESGKRVWQSGVAMVTSDAKDTWILGIGPFQRGSIYDGTNFVGAEVLTPFARGKSKQKGNEKGPNRQTLANVTSETIFQAPPRPTPEGAAPSTVMQATHTAPAATTPAAPNAQPPETPPAALPAATAAATPLPVPPSDGRLPPPTAQTAPQSIPPAPPAGTSPPKNASP